MAEINCSIDYKVEYELRRDINSKDGEILKLEYINAKHCREIESLTKRINVILETTEDSPQDLFEYTKALIVELSRKAGLEPVDPDDIDRKYVESAIRYTMPGLFSMYALLSGGDFCKIEFADRILEKFGIQTIAKYEELVQRGDIDIQMIDRRAMPEGRK